MIGARLRFAGPSLPLTGGHEWSFLPWAFALFVYVAAAAALGLLALSGASRGGDQSPAARLTVQIPAEASSARLQTALAILQHAPGIRSVHQLTTEETARLLEPWLGAPVPVEELPVPRLLDLEVDPDAAIDLAKLREQLVSVIPDARLDDHRAPLGGEQPPARPLRVVLAAIAAAALLLTALLAAFMTHTALAVRWPVVVLLNLLGAADADIARPLALRALWLAGIGAVLGAAAALLTILALGGGARWQPLPNVAIGLADWRVLAVLIGIAVAAVLLAAASTVAVVRRRLARMP